MKTWKTKPSCSLCPKTKGFNLVLSKEKRNILLIYITRRLRDRSRRSSWSRAFSAVDWVHWQNVLRQNVPWQYVPWQKRPSGQNVPRNTTSHADKKSQRTHVPRDKTSHRLNISQNKTSQGINVPRDKTPQRQNVPQTKHPTGQTILLSLCATTEWLRLRLSSNIGKYSRTYYIQLIFGTTCSSPVPVKIYCNISIETNDGWRANHKG